MIEWQFEHFKTFTPYEIMQQAAAPPVLSACLLKASGKSFMMTEQHIMYQFLLNSCYHMSIFDCNEMLTAQGLKPLGRQNRVS